MPKRRRKRRAPSNKLAGLGVLAVIAIAVVVGLQVWPSSTPEVDYSTGDGDLRAILLDPTTAPRYAGGGRP